jgi:hypothetical protein
VINYLVDKIFLGVVHQQWPRLLQGTRWPFCIVILFSV